MDDLVEMILPALGMIVTPMAAQGLLTSLPSKYTSAFGGLLGLGIGGAAIAGEVAAAWVLINMVDDVKLVVDS
jgi:hypothetical protein